MHSSSVVQRVAQDYEVEGKDTNFNAFICGAAEEFWEYDPEIINREILDDDYIGDEEWVSVSINGDRVWDDRETSASKDILSFSVSTYGGSSFRIDLPPGEVTRPCHGAHGPGSPRAQGPQGPMDPQGPIGP